MIKSPPEMTINNNNNPTITSYFKHKIYDHLTDEQNVALHKFIEGKNLFITGPGGVGKSTLIDTIYHHANRKQQKIYKTSTTGISALNIGGKTIHSWAGIKLGEGTADELIKKMFFKTKEKWKNTDILIIDEVSMLSPELLDKLNLIAKKLRRSLKPFGGIQIILVGDFCQLPVVKNERFAFEADCWNEIVDEVVHMKQIIRQTDLYFQTMLNEIRYGICSDDTIKMLKSRVGIPLKLENGIEPTRLYPKNNSANRVNTNKLNSLPGEVKIYNASYSLNHNYSSQKKKELFNVLRKNSPVEDIIKLKVGAQVMFKKNIPEWNVVNGSRGVVKGFEGDNAIVSIVSGEDVTVTPIKFLYESESDGEEFCAVKLQIPLKLAWATTIHASQGTTLDYVAVDAGINVFSEGQTYVALSRVKTLEGLTLISFDPDSIEANQKVLDFYKTA